MYSQLKTIFPEAVNWNVRTTLGLGARFQIRSVQIKMHNYIYERGASVRKSGRVGEVVS